MEKKKLMFFNWPLVEKSFLRAIFSGEMLTPSYGSRRNKICG